MRNYHAFRIFANTLNLEFSASQGVRFFQQAWLSFALSQFIVITFATSMASLHPQRRGAATTRRFLMMNNVYGHDYNEHNLQNPSRSQPDRILRPKEAAEIYGIAISTLYARLKPGNSQYDPSMPKRFPIHSNPSGCGAVGFLESEVLAHLKTMKNRSNTR